MTDPPEEPPSNPWPDHVGRSGLPEIDYSKLKRHKSSSDRLWPAVVGLLGFLLALLLVAAWAVGRAY